MRWEAKWICHPEDNRVTRLVPVFRRKFEVSGHLLSARLSITSHGIYRAEVNGREVTENRFTPGLTSYYQRIQYQEYDITGLLQEGVNVFEVTVGDGWWRWKNNFGGRLALAGQIEMEYPDGCVTIATDEDFEVGIGPVVRTDLQKGETFDARMQAGCWQRPIIETAHTDAALVPTEGVPVREKECFDGRRFKDSAGNTVFDFGQNIAGYVRMRLYDTRPGQVVHLKHGEGLDPEGRFSTGNCDGGMGEFQEITYICKGADVEEYMPYFAVFGFRYVLVEGIEDGSFTAVAVYSDMEETGDFQCSDPLINKLVENARWSQKGNFLDVAVDCPTRERNAWTGDAQVYVRTAAYFMDVFSFFEKWLKDQALEQYGSGKLGITFPSTSSVHDPEELKRVQSRDPHMALAGPDGNGNIGEDSVGWGDSAVWIPYQLYLMYGEKSILENQYETARRWLEYSLGCMRDKNPIYAEKPWYLAGDDGYIYDTKFHYGEWNEPLPPSAETVAFFKSGKSAAEYVEYMAQFGKPEVATAYTKRSCDNMAHMAEILDRKEDAARYRALSARIKDAYDRYMIGEDGVIQEGHQAAYIRALALGLVSERKKPRVLEQLKRELAAAEYHLNTGFLSTVYLLPTLCDNGMTEEAFRILEQTGAPGWLHPITLGATTMLENWDGMDVYRDSFNHYSFGAVCQFLFEYVAGIRPVFAAPGFREFELKPLMGGTLTWAKARYRTRYGLIRSEWERSGDGEYVYSCLVSEGTTAHLTLPDGRAVRLDGGKYTFQGRL